MAAAVNDEYTDTFFSDAKTDEGYDERLRAVVQNTLANFEEAMRIQGRARYIIEPSLAIQDEDIDIYDVGFHDSISRDEFYLGQQTDEEEQRARAAGDIQSAHYKRAFLGAVPALEGYCR